MDHDTPPRRGQAAMLVVFVLVPWAALIGLMVLGGYFAASILGAP